MELTITLTDEENKQLALQAKSVGLNKGNYIKRLLKDFEIEKNESIIKKPSGAEAFSFFQWAHSAGFKRLLYLRPMTEEQYYLLREKYSAGVICNTLILMENWNGIVKKKFLYHTLRDWLKKTVPTLKPHQ